MASAKVTALTLATVPALTDLLYLVTDVAGTPDSNAISVLNLLYKVQTLTDQATVAWDLSLGGFATVTLAGNRTLAAPTNIRNGSVYWLFVIQDATGNRTLSWNAAYKFPGGTDPTLSTGANAVDLIRFIANGTALYGLFGGNYS